MKKLLRILVDMIVLAALAGLLYIRYNQRVAEVGEPTWECPICGERTEVVSKHYIDCVKHKVEEEVYVKK